MTNAALLIHPVALFVCLAATSPPLLAQQPPAAAPMIKENATVKLAAHTYAIPAGMGGVPNVGIIVGSRATLVIDTGMGPRNGAIVLSETRKVSSNTQLYLATTHVHPEHDLGAGAFPPSTTMIRARNQVKDIEEFAMQTVDAFRGRSAINAELLKGAEYRKADVVFETEHLLDLGRVRVRIMAVGPTHTRGDTVFWVEGDGVLFAGDVAMPALPAFGSPYSSMRVWLATLDALAALKPVHVVPSHGALGDASLISGYQTFMKSVQARAGELKAQGKSVDEAVETISRELQAKYANQTPARIGAAARIAYAEAAPAR